MQAQNVSDSSALKSPRRPHKSALRAVVLIISGLCLLFTAFAAGATATWFLAPQVRERFSSAPEQAGSGAVEQATLQQRASLLWDIQKILGNEYLLPEDLDATRLLYGAASGMVGALGDPHTVFVEPAAAAIIDEDMQGSFEGIGATVEMVDGHLRIVRPLPNSPAERAGLLAGDIILSVNGNSLSNLDVSAAIHLIRGPRGTTATLVVQRDGVAEPFTVSVTRDRLELPNVETKMLEGNIGHVRLGEFNALSYRQVHEAVVGLLDQGATGVILDLRDNPGGYLDSAVDIASEFLPRDSLVLKERVRNQPEIEHRVRARGVALAVPLVVLVNENSASASEIVAGALQQDRRATLVGTKTYGKGSVQHTHTLSDGSSLRVTVAKWLLPDGTNLDGEGIAPDIGIDISADDLSAGRDAQLDRAVQYLREGK